MSGEKLAKLIRILAEKSELGEAGWEETERADTFQVAFSNSAVRISSRESRQHRGDEEIVISFHNASGAKVEEITDESFEGMENSYSFFRRTFELARRKAIGVDQTIDSILEDLESGLF